MSSVTKSPSADAGLRERASSLLRQLRTADNGHAAARLSTCEGVAPTALDADVGRWIEIGGAIAALARLIQAHSAASQFCSARPDIEVLATRISETIDDQLDGPSWGLVDAVAKLEAARSLSCG
jgi:hypothetical protein